MRTEALAAAIGALAAALAGCALTRQVTNRDLAREDFAFIEVGRTDWREVLARLGPPPEFVSGPSAGRGALRAFRYDRAETACAVLNVQCYLCPIPVSPLLPFEWCDEQRTRRVLVEFDAWGVVSAVSDSRVELLWLPFEDEEDRFRRVLTTLDGKDAEP